MTESLASVSPLFLKKRSLAIIYDKLFFILIFFRHPFYFLLKLGFFEIESPLLLGCPPPLSLKAEGDEEVKVAQPKFFIRFRDILLQLWPLPFLGSLFKRSLAFGFVFLDLLNIVENNGDRCSVLGDASYWDTYDWVADRGRGDVIGILIFATILSRFNFGNLLLLNNCVILSLRLPLQASAPKMFPKFSGYCSFRSPFFQGIKKP